jgi:hypothetical protein
MLTMLQSDRLQVVCPNSNRRASLYSGAQGYLEVQTLDNHTNRCYYFCKRLHKY